MTPDQELVGLTTLVLCSFLAMAAPGLADCCLAAATILLVVASYLGDES